MDKNTNAVFIFNKLAKEYQDKFMNVDLYGNTFNAFCNLLPLNAEVLELACGPGNITKYLLKLRPDLKITGTDLSENMIKLAMANNPFAEFKIMDGRELKHPDKKYDAIMCGFLLPYLSKPEAICLIDDACMCLKPTGLIYISTMEDRYDKSGFKKGSAGDEIFMHYHEAGYLNEALQTSGFTIKELDRKEYPGANGEKTVDLIIIAQKNVVAPSANT
ncbi:MAG: hypothetical protein JWO32_1010 [Bacteroidetes bacterium]|nr:hypothetical protein [Bacteroidota bacterium]